MACLILSLTALLVMWSLYEMPSSFLKHLISVACNFFRMSDINVQLSQAHNCTETTRERIRLIFELRGMCLSLQMVFSLASAAVVCVILDSTSGLEPWSVTTAPRYLKLSTTSNFSPLILCQCWCHLQRFHSCFDLFPQDWVVISVSCRWDNQLFRVTFDCVAVQFCAVLCPPL